MSHCTGCGLPGYYPTCPVCAGDWDAALAHGLIQPEEPEPQPTPEEECEMLSQHAPTFEVGPLVLGCWCGSVQVPFSTSARLPA